VPALPSSVLEPCGSRSLRCCPSARSTTRSAATAPASLVGRELKDQAAGCDRGD
jgi:hypothetical protein